MSQITGENESPVFDVANISFPSEIRDTDVLGMLLYTDCKHKWWQKFFLTIFRKHNHVIGYWRSGKAGSQWER